LEAELPIRPFRCRPDEGEHDGADAEHLAPEDLGRVRGAETQAFSVGVSPAGARAIVQRDTGERGAGSVELSHAWPPEKEALPARNCLPAVCFIRMTPSGGMAREAADVDAHIEGLSRDREADRMIADLDARGIDSRQQIERLRRSCRSRKGQTMTGQ
jgi:hypothetical protein